MGPTRSLTKARLRARIAERARTGRPRRSRSGLNPASRTQIQPRAISRRPISPERMRRPIQHPRPTPAEKPRWSGWPRNSERPARNRTMLATTPRTHARCANTHERCSRASARGSVKSSNGSRRNRRKKCGEIHRRNPKAVTAWEIAALYRDVSPAGMLPPIHRRMNRPAPPRPSRPHAPEIAGLGPKVGTIAARSQTKANEELAFSTPDPSRLSVERGSGLRRWFRPGRDRQTRVENRRRVSVRLWPIVSRAPPPGLNGRWSSRPSLNATATWCGVSFGNTWNGRVRTRPHHNRPCRH